jgi:hypothetical protein
MSRFRAVQHAGFRATFGGNSQFGAGGTTPFARGGMPVW